MRTQVASAAVAAVLVVATMAVPAWAGNVGPTHAVVVVVPVIPSPGSAVPPWTVGSVGAVVAKPLLHSLEALRPFPNVGFFCPVDIGVTYLITFWDGPRPVAVASADPSGCQEVREWGPGLRERNAWALTDSTAGRRFWRLMATALDLPEPDVTMPGLFRLPS